MLFFVVVLSISVNRLADKTHNVSGRNDVNSSQLIVD